MKQTTLDALAASHDAFLVDQFGVLLDGSAAYPWASRALSRLAATGKPVILLSNSGKRSAPNAERLLRLGFAREAFRLVLSSGEAAWLDLAQRGLEPGAAVWLHARDGDTSAVDGLGLRIVDSPDQATLLVLAGSQADVVPMADYAAQLRGAAVRKVPMLCTNPDIEMLTPRGPFPGAGQIAQLYQSLGGPVEWIGKPHPLIYRAAARLLPGIPPGRILCIGDSPAHDVAGGQAAGHATALVRTGLHAGVPDDDLRDLCAHEGGVPDYVIPRFAFQED